MCSPSNPNMLKSKCSTTSTVTLRPSPAPRLPGQAASVGADIPPTLPGDIVDTAWTLESPVQGVGHVHGALAGEAHWRPPPAPVCPGMLHSAHTPRGYCSVCKLQVHRFTMYLSVHELRMVNNYSCVGSCFQSASWFFQQGRFYSVLSDECLNSFRQMISYSADLGDGSTL